MPGSLSVYLENKVVDHILATTTYTKPTSVYVGLLTVSPTESTNGTEVTGGSYSRKIQTFPASVNGFTANSANIDFASMPACTVVAYGIYDAATLGNLLMYTTLSEPRTVTAGSTLRIVTGDLTVSVN